jgi:CubicO group peptidase (beta-lactamase class C family)
MANHRNPLLAILAGAAVSCVKPSPQGPPAQEARGWPSPEAAGIDSAALRRLVDGARASQADALVVVKDGRLVLEDLFDTPDGPIEAMSATKSVVSLAVGMLLDEGRLSSLDQPVSDFYPAWRQGKKARITVRHLLSHTSGIANAPPISDGATRGSDWVRVALEAELSSEPGTAWFYNNKAVNLIPGIVKEASGQRLDEYLRDRLFSPLGITSYGWRLDGAGTPLGMAGLEIRPRDLATIGAMLAEGGTWRGRRIVSSAWIETSALRQSQDLNPRSGLLWWLVGGELEPGPIIDKEGLAKLKKVRADPALIEKLSKLEGRVPKSQRDAVEILRRTLGPDGLDRWMREVAVHGVAPKLRRLGPPTGFMANGYLGQYLWVSPKDRLVVVCMHRQRAEDVINETPSRKEFPELEALVSGLMRSPRPAVSTP